MLKFWQTNYWTFVRSKSKCADDFAFESFKGLRSLLSEFVIIFIVDVNRKLTPKNSKRLAKVQSIDENWVMDEMMRSHHNRKQRIWLHRQHMLRQYRLKH